MVEEFKLVQWYAGQSPKDPAINRRHLELLRAIVDEAGGDLEGLELVVNWDRRWGEREENRRRLGTKSDGRFLWLVLPSKTADNERG